jgi:hypothetical protein
MQYRGAFIPAVWKGKLFFKKILHLIFKLLALPGIKDLESKASQLIE